MKKNYARLTRELTGMTPQQYKTAYTKFAAQVRNYNKIAGTDYKASQQFYYSFKYAGDETAALQAIQATPATRARGAGMAALTGQSFTRVESAARDVVFSKWKGFIDASKRAFDDGFGEGEALHVAQLLDAGLITPAEADRQFREIARVRDIRRDNDPSYRY